MRSTDGMTESGRSKNDDGKVHFGFGVCVLLSLSFTQASVHECILVLITHSRIEVCLAQIRGRQERTHLTAINGYVFV